MATIKVTRTALALAMIACACETEPPPDDTLDAGPPPYDDLQLSVELAESPPPGPGATGQESEIIAPQERTGPHGFKVPEDGDNPPAPPLGDAARARAELAALDRELSAILDPIVDDLQARGVTREQIEEAMGDIRAERMLLGLSLPEYHDLQRKLDGLLERARPLLTARPLTRDGRGGDEMICTTTTTVDEWDDGTIVITDHESCRPGFPDDGGSSGGCLLGGPGCGDGPNGGGGGGPTAFEFACANAGGVIRYDKCRCKRGAKCHDSIFEAGLAYVPCLIWPPACVGSGLAWVRVMWMCRQKPCDEVNRRHGK